MTTENEKCESFCSCTEQAETDMVLLPTQQAEVRERLVFFRELIEGRDKVKMSVENEPRRCKEKKVYELQILGHP